MDVLLSTASIMNLCLISLDRYWSITKAVEYLKTRTPARALVMIAAVWIMSALICIPPLLGWGVKRTEDSLPQCEVSLFVLSFLPKNVPTLREITKIGPNRTEPKEIQIKRSNRIASLVMVMLFTETRKRHSLFGLFII